MELRLAEDRSTDNALVRLKHEHVQLKAAAERTAAELHQLRASRSDTNGDLPIFPPGAGLANCE